MSDERKWSAFNVLGLRQPIWSTIIIVSLLIGLTYICLNNIGQTVVTTSNSGVPLRQKAKLVAFQMDNLVAIFELFIEKYCSYFAKLRLLLDLDDGGQPGCQDAPPP